MLHALFLTTIVSTALVMLGAAIGHRDLLWVPPIVAVVAIMLLVLESSGFTSKMILELAAFVVVADASLACGVTLRQRVAR